MKIHKKKKLYVNLKIIFNKYDRVAGISSFLLFSIENNSE